MGILLVDSRCRTSISHAAGRRGIFASLPMASTRSMQQRVVPCRGTSLTAHRCPVQHVLLPICYEFFRRRLAHRGKTRYHSVGQGPRPIHGAPRGGEDDARALGWFQWRGKYGALAARRYRALCRLCGCVPTEKSPYYLGSPSSEKKTDGMDIGRYWDIWQKATSQLEYDSYSRRRLNGRGHVLFSKEDGIRFKRPFG